MFFRPTYALSQIKPGMQDYSGQFSMAFETDKSADSVTLLLGVRWVVLAFLQYYFCCKHSFLVNIFDCFRGITVRQHVLPFLLPKLICQL